MTIIPRYPFLNNLQEVCDSADIRLLGVVTLKKETQEFQRFESWLARGWQAGMDFLTRNKELREDPRGLLPQARTAILLALPYDLGERYNRKVEKPRIAQYARFRDYHKTIQKKGQTLIEWIRSQGEAPMLASYRVIVDSAPVLERALASRTTKGFIGKNTCYIHPEWGSLLLLGAILSSLEIEPDPPAEVDPAKRVPGIGGCGTCRRCQVNCPTGALDEAYVLNANRCLAYWTIEHRGTIPMEFWPWLTKYWFGCDICQLVCPYNRAQPVPAARKQRSRKELEALDLFDVALMSQREYEEWFGGTPLTRAKRAGLRRNALIVLAVKNDPRLEQALAGLGSCDEQVLHDTARQIQEYRSALHI